MRRMFKFLTSGDWNRPEMIASIERIKDAHIILSAEEFEAKKRRMPWVLRIVIRGAIDNRISAEPDAEDVNELRALEVALR